MAGNIFDDLRDRIDIVDLISKYVPLKRSGSNFAGCCPFHNEKTPSFIVSPSKQIFKCFGCGKGGDIFSFLQEIERIDLWDAVKLLAEREHLNLADYQINSYKDYHKDEKEKLKRMHKLAQEFFTTKLAENPQALQYLKEKRNLNDETIATFGIGYAPDSFSDLLNFLRGKGFTDEDLLQGSLAKKNEKGDVFAFFRNRITFPIYDLMNNVVGFTARVLNPDEMPKYLNSSEHRAFEKGKILYGLSHAKPHIVQEKKVMIVEGQMDVIGLFRLGFPFGVATSGTALTENHVKTLKRLTDTIYLLFDNDSAGLQATFRALKLFYHQNLYPKMLVLPEGIKDVDELANKPEGNQIFSSLLSSSDDGFIVFFERLRKTFDMNSPIDKQKFINSMFELIVSMDNVISQEDFKRKLADKLGFPIGTINIQFEQYQRGEGKFFLRQQEQQAHQEEPKYKIDREALFDALFFKEFIKNLIQNEDFLSQFFAFGKVVAKALPESLLAEVIQGKIDEEQQKELTELQLWWEGEIGKYQDQETRIGALKKLLRGAGKHTKLQLYTQMSIKSSYLTPEEKQELNKMKLKLVA